jgi:predicted naringenin-chalcone synthase
MFLESVGAASPRHALRMEDRHQVAELYVTGDEKDRWFVESIFEKTTVQGRPSVLLKSSAGDLQQRQSFFPPASRTPCGKGPTTAARMRAYQVHACELAASACADAFGRSGIGPDEITHLVTASCTGFSAPGFDLELVDRLPLSPHVKRTHLGFMGCHAGLNCLRVAEAYTRADSASRALVCSVELCGLHYQYDGAPDQIVANALFADGSGAAIVTASPATHRKNGWEIAGTGSCIIPDSSGMMKWNIEDHGFTMTLSDRIPDMVKKHSGPWLRSWLATYGIAPEQVNSWAVHPGGPQILNAFEVSLSLDSLALQPSRHLLREKGNMSSASVFFLLRELLTSPGTLPCVAVGFGPGLTVEAVLFRSPPQASTPMA